MEDIDMNSFQTFIKEICDEKRIKFELLSKDWIMKLTKFNSSEYIVGAQFPINNSSSSLICTDKYAAFKVLTSSNIPILDSKLIYSNRIKDYVSDLKNKDEWNEYFLQNEFVEIKNNLTRAEDKVYIVNNYNRAIDCLNEIFELNNTAVVRPFVNAESIFNVICLNKDVKLVFEQKRQIKYSSKVSIMEFVKNERLKEELIKIALKVVNTIGINFASIDIIEFHGELVVMEVSCNADIHERLDAFGDNKITLKNIYSNIIDIMFNENKR